MSEQLLHAVFALGGGLGAVARHALSRQVTHRLPVSTLIVNVLGSLILGLAVALLVRDGSGSTEEARRLAFGFCGGFTTFSSFAYQTLDLHHRHTVLHTAGNIVISLAACLFAYSAGLALF